MFKNGTLEERYELSLTIHKKVKKVAKIFGFLMLAVFGFLSLALAFAPLSDGGQFTVGVLMTAIAGFPIGYLYGHIMGSALAWAYYWFKIKFNIDSLISVFLAMFLQIYVGIPVWIKYGRYYKKLAGEMKKTELHEAVR